MRAPDRPLTVGRNDHRAAAAAELKGVTDVNDRTPNDHWTRNA